jgi:hypothetical protein
MSHAVTPPDMRERMAAVASELARRAGVGAQPRSERAGTA